MVPYWGTFDRPIIKEAKSDKFSYLGYSLITSRELVVVIFLYPSVSPSKTTLFGRKQIVQSTNLSSKINWITQSIAVMK